MAGTAAEDRFNSAGQGPIALWEKLHCALRGLNRGGNGQCSLARTYFAPIDAPWNGANRGRDAVNAATSTARALKPGMDPTEWKVRVDLAAAFRLAALQDWDELLFAHLSARVPNHPNQFLMHPAAILFEEVTASNLHKLDENCNHVEPSDELPHKFAFPFHKGIYDAFPQAQCVMHLHTKYATAVAMQEHGLIPGNQYALWLGPVGYHDYEGLLSTRRGRPAPGAKFRQQADRPAARPRLRAVGPQRARGLYAGVSRHPRLRDAGPLGGRCGRSLTCRRKRCSTRRSAKQKSSPTAISRSIR